MSVGDCAAANAEHTKRLEDWLQELQEENERIKDDYEGRITSMKVSTGDTDSE